MHLHLLLHLLITQLEAAGGFPLSFLYSRLEPALGPLCAPATYHHGWPFAELTQQNKCLPCMREPALGTPLPVRYHKLDRGKPTALDTRAVLLVMPPCMCLALAATLSSSLLKPFFVATLGRGVMKASLREEDIYPAAACPHSRRLSCRVCIFIHFTCSSNSYFI